MSHIIKKLVTLLVISLLVIVASMKAVQRPNLSLTKQAIDKSRFISKTDCTSSAPILEYAHVSITLSASEKIRSI